MTIILIFVETKIYIKSKKKKREKSSESVAASSEAAAPEMHYYRKVHCHFQEERERKKHLFEHSLLYLWQGCLRLLHVF